MFTVHLQCISDVGAVGTTSDMVTVTYILFFAVDTLQWRKVDGGGLPARYEHTSFTVGSDLYLFAGAQTTGPLNDIWRYQYCMYIVMQFSC